MIKILIADDQSKKYARLLDALTAVSIQRDQVTIVQSANQAREQLEANAYNLFILDILLPLWPEGEEAQQHSFDLLFELNETDTYSRPNHIVGITADRDVAAEAGPRFQEWTWTVVDYSESNDDWIHRIVNCVKYLSAEILDGAPPSQPEVDLAIVCALAEPELEEVLKLPWNWTAPRPIDELTFVHGGHLMVDNQHISVCVTSAPRMGMISTALLSAKCIALLRPKLLAMCGICAGVEGKVSIGDVLLADPSWDFQSGKRVKDKQNRQFSVAPHQLPAPSVIRTHVEQIRADRQTLARISTEYGSDAPGMSRVVIGPVASGSAVLADGEVVQEIKAQHRELCGVEMETYGLYAAAHAASSPQPLAFSLKGVCDFANPDKADDNQRFAAYASAQVLRLLIERFGPRLINRAGAHLRPD